MARAAPLACIRARQLISRPTLEAAGEMVASSTDASMLLAYVPRVEPDVVRVDKAHAGKLIFVEGTGYTSAPI